MRRLAALPGWIAALGFLALALATVWVRTFPAAWAPISQVYNEGWNAYHAVAAVTGGVLYPPPESFVFNNYPPLSFYLVGWAGELAGNPLTAGRILASAGLVASALFIGIAAFRLGAGALGGVAAAATAGVLSAALYIGYVGMNDPQWLGHALMSAGLAVFVARRPGRGSDALAAVLMVAAGMVKHNLLPVPLAATLWLLLEDRARLLRWIAFAALAVLVALAATYALHGAAAFASILAHERVTVLHRAVEFGRLIFAPLLPLAWVACAVAWMAATQPAARLALLYLLIAAATGLGSLTGEGVWWNAAFDTVLALSLAGGLAVGWIGRLPATAAARGAAASLAVLALLLPFARTAEGGIWAAIQYRRDLPARAAQEGALVRAIAAVPGPVSCDELPACFWAGKPFLLDPFNAEQRAKRLPEARAALGRMMEQGAFGALQLNADGKGTLSRLVDLAAPDLPQHWQAQPMPGGGKVLERP